MDTETESRAYYLLGRIAGDDKGTEIIEELTRLLNSEAISRALKETGEII